MTPIGRIVTSCCVYMVYNQTILHTNKNELKGTKNVTSVNQSPRETPIDIRFEDKIPLSRRDEGEVNPLPNPPLLGGNYWWEDERLEVNGERLEVNGVETSYHGVSWQNAIVIVIAKC